VVAEISLPEGASLRSGRERETLSQLEGRAYTASAISPWVTFGVSTADRAKVEWVVHAPQGGTIRVTAKHDRAGVVQAEFEVK
jgi:hypothetical protein